MPSYRKGLDHVLCQQSIEVLSSSMPVYRKGEDVLVIIKTTVMTKVFYIQRHNLYDSVAYTRAKTSTMSYHITEKEPMLGYAGTPHQGMRSPSTAQGERRIS
jgi:hypothetical protein